MSMEMKNSDAEEKYVIRPSYKNMFKPRAVKDIMKDILAENLAEQSYDSLDSKGGVSVVTKSLASQIKNELKELVVIGEMKGAGVRIGSRCLWDAQTDKVAEVEFKNDDIFCVAVAFGVIEEMVETGFAELVRPSTGHLNPASI